MKILKKIVSIAAAGMMSVMLAFSAMAAESQLDFSELKATVSVTGASFSDETFGLVLQSVDGAPMPAGSTDGTKSYQTGVLNSQNRSETVSLGSIAYTQPGIYKYNLTETAGSTTRMTYDSTVYHIFVKVVNGDTDGLKLESMWVSKNDSGEKLSAISFENTKSAGSSGGGGGGGGSNTYHSVTPNGSTGTTTSEGGQVLGANRGPVGELIEAVAESPVGQVLGATRKAVQTGDSSTMMGMGLGFLACLAVLGCWCIVYRKQKRSH